MSEAKQRLDWQSGDVYRTESGEALQITAIVRDENAKQIEYIECRVADFPHLFDLEGRALCCKHGDLLSRLTGSINQ